MNAWRTGASVVAGACKYWLSRLDLPGFGDSPITQLPTTYAADRRPVGRPEIGVDVPAEVALA